MDLAFNNLQWLMRHKTQANQQATYPTLAILLDINFYYDIITSYLPSLGLAARHMCRVEYQWLA